MVPYNYLPITHFIQLSYVEVELKSILYTICKIKTASMRSITLQFIFAQQRLPQDNCTFPPPSPKFQVRLHSHCRFNHYPLSDLTVSFTLLTNTKRK